MKKCKAVEDVLPDLEQAVDTAKKLPKKTRNRKVAEDAIPTKGASCGDSEEATQTNKQIGGLGRGCAFGEGPGQQDSKEAGQENKEVVQTNKEVGQENGEAKDSKGCGPKHRASGGIYKSHITREGIA